jgi:hypothetical protein
MAPKRILGPTLVVFALVVAACGTSTSSGAATSSAPSSAPAASAPASAAASAEASAAASAEASVAPSAAAEGDLVSKIPTMVGDVALAASATDGETYLKTNVNRQLTPILTALGKTPADVAVATSTGSSADGSSLNIDAVEIPGADATKAQTAFQTAATALKTNEVKTADMGGKNVVQVTTPSYTLAVFAVGDTIWYVQSTNADLVTQGVTALPS